MFDFGERLKQLRDEQGLTQAQVAKRLNLNHSTISSYEANTREPSIDILKGLASIYNTTVDYIVGAEPKKMLCVDGLTPQQVEIIKLTMSEFKSLSKVK